MAKKKKVSVRKATKQKKKQKKKKIKKKIKIERKKRKREMGKTFSKTKNVMAATYYLLGILFFVIAFLILFGLFIPQTFTFWFQP